MLVAIIIHMILSASHNSVCSIDGCMIYLGVNLNLQDVDSTFFAACQKGTPMFRERLDFLMRLTNTHNSVLGRAVHVDASTISRLRSGKRDLPKKQDFVKPMSAFFARAIKDVYQLNSISESIIPGHPWPEDENQAASLIQNWLLGKITVQDVAVSKLLVEISHFSFSQTSSELPAESVANFDEPEAPSVMGSSYIGHEGKRSAVAAFLNAAIQNPVPTTLLLYSDESMQWLYEDAHFAQHWARLMKQVIANGNRIRIIHTISRSLDEMLEAIFKWLPIYMSGAVEPYYFPRLRDGVFRRTLFITPGRAAVVSSSVGTRTEQSLNLLINDSRSLSALEYEFQNYFSQCLPLMCIMKAEHGTEVTRLLSELGAARGEAIVAHNGLSLATMPEEVAMSICSHNGNNAIMKLRAEQAEIFAKGIRDFGIHEIICLPSAETMQSNRIPLTFPNILGMSGYSYTRTEFIQHLHAVLDLNRTQPNYHISLSSSLLDNMLIYHKEQVGVVVARTDPQPIVFAFDEPIVTKAFGEYLHKQIDLGQDSITTLQCFLDTNTV